jgi:predicted Fe-Mo cluster-binding NifX family protein
MAHAPKVDVVVLAQASMAPAAEALSEQLGMEVLASPRLGVQRAINQVRSRRTKLTS